MNTPCEILLATGNPLLAHRLFRLSVKEAQRIEKKFSRYLSDSAVHRINENRGRPLPVDDETAALIDFADQAYRLSDGLFDITTGVLRHLWRFDGKSRLPSPGQVQSFLGRVGWSRVRWNRPVIELPEGMEIDLGGIAKEYAVDKIRGLLETESDTPALVNLGGDLAVSNGPKTWTVGIEGSGPPPLAIGLKKGALATSGDTHRHFVSGGQRWGHILDPRTGYPVRNAPRSVTVAGNTCTEAGLLSTLAMLHGEKAGAFLASQSVRHWILG